MHADVSQLNVKQQATRQDIVDMQAGIIQIDTNVSAVEEAQLKMDASVRHLSEAKGISITHFIIN